MLISLSPTCISILLSPSEAAECVCTTVFLRLCEGISFILYKNAHSVQLASFCRFSSGVEGKQNGEENTSLSVRAVE